MKTTMILSLCAGLMFPAGLTQAALYTYDFNTTSRLDGGVIPDGNPVGLMDTRVINDIPLGYQITDVNVRLTVTGGWNGDLYCYLTYDNTLVTLLNRVGTGTGTEPTFSYGFATSGFNDVGLDNSGGMGDIHQAATPGSSTHFDPSTYYTPDGGNLSLFNGKNPNGSWTLFFADMSGGDVSTVTGWSLDITAIPEPTHIALAVFGGFLAVGGLVRSRRVRAMLGRSPA